MLKKKAFMVYGDPRFEYSPPARQGSAYPQAIEVSSFHARDK